MQVTIQRTRSTGRSFLLQSCLMILAAVAAVASVFETAWSAEPGIVARVNQSPVTLAELQRMLADPLTQHQLQQELRSGAAEGKKVEHMALRKLIQQRLLLQEAERRNFIVSDDDFNQALSSLRSRFQDVRGFGAWMKERGLDDRTLFDTIRAQVLMTKVWGALVKDVKVPEKQVQVFYEAHKEDLAIGEEVRLRIIAVQSKMEAEEVLAALRKGASFRRLARSRSQGTLAAQGGDTGWVNSGTLPPALRPHVAALKTGDVSGPIQKDENEFLLIGLQGRRVLRAHSLIEARPEIERRLLPEKQREVIAAWLTDQEKKSAIEVLLQPEHVRE